jgi:hypothetical protein
VYAEMCRALPEGQADADAFLSGEVMPSARKEKRRRHEVFATAGGDVIPCR